MKKSNEEIPVSTLVPTSAPTTEYSGGGDSFEDEI